MKMMQKFNIHNQALLIFNIQYKLTQIAQLFQRDRVAGCISFGQKWKTNWETILFCD